jgi:hypothetical protein
MPAPDRVAHLGSITAPSGTLLIGDMGYLDMWSGTKPPHVPPTIEDERVRDLIANARDFRIVGADAPRAAAVFGRQSLTYVYDIPDEDGLRSAFQDAIREHGFNARLEVEEHRVPHRERARRAAAAGGADFIINGVWFVAVGGLATDTPMPVVAHRKDYGDGVGPRWEHVELRVSDARPTATETLGYVGVDWARLILTDADAIEAWEHDEPLDGKADVAFWGADAETCAAIFSAQALPEGVFGWEDLPLEEALDRGLAIEQWMQREGKRMAVDFRPHSHHYLMMRQVRASADEAGMLALGDAITLGLMTSWGDGVFPVQADRSADGQLVAVRVVLGDEDRRARTAQLAAARR